ncbi:MAG TPA: response regulator [Chitinophagaceae bacterium]
MLTLRRTVLCVDDDPDDQLMVLDSIKAIDPTMRVASALNGVEALRFLEESKQRGQLPCLVLMDINMPLMDGKQAITHIKKDKELDRVPVVMFTTSSSAVDQTFCELHGVPFITKPISQRGLEETVKRLLHYYAA